MYCTTCGSQCEDHAPFCPACGNPLSSANLELRTVTFRNPKRPAPLLAIKSVTLSIDGAPAFKIPRGGEVQLQLPVGAHTIVGPVIGYDAGYTIDVQEDMVINLGYDYHLFSFYVRSDMTMQVEDKNK